MRHGLTILTIVLLIASSALAGGAVRPQFAPAPYQSADGALVMQPDAVEVEPYFATKALLSAQDAGLDIHGAALSWIEWMLPRQTKDGRIQRFCRKPGSDWRVCGQADADDSMLALWMQLLYRVAPDTGLPPAWQESADRAQRHLAKLRNDRLGIYHVSRQNHAGLFMDNVEVYAALKDVAAAQARFGDRDGAARTEQRAEDLARAIRKIFWDDRAHAWRVSTQKREHHAFYPDAVAQTFAWLEDFPSPVDPRSAWRTWLTRFAADWLYQARDPHPWGLLALTASHLGDSHSAVCWLARAQSLRYGPRWNILEEAVYQGLHVRFRDESGSAPVACSRVLVNHD